LKGAMRRCVNLFMLRASRAVAAAVLMHVIMPERDLSQSGG